MTLSAALSNQPTVRTGCFQLAQKSYSIYTDKHTFSVPKRQPLLQADLIINRLRWEALVDRQRDAFDVDYVAEFYFCFLEP